ncbi:MAG TPA: hypothetical protein VN931_09155 [Fibrobacteria bacterium]|nr:hypothetical protein [Fibrobacteria bacterium]
MLILFIALLATPSAPACDAPEVRQALVYEWGRMVPGHGDTLQGSDVRVWNLREDGKIGDCRADFLARRPGAAIGGSVPFRIQARGAGFRLLSRGSPDINLFQADSTKR